MTDGEVVLRTGWVICMIIRGARPGQAQCENVTKSWGLDCGLVVSACSVNSLLAGAEDWRLVGWRCEAGGGLARALLVASSEELAAQHSDNQYWATNTWHTREEQIIFLVGLIFTNQSTNHHTTLCQHTSQHCEPRTPKWGNGSIYNLGQIQTYLAVR